MEKQLLFLLDWDLRITPEDLYTHLDPFLAPIRDQHESQLHEKEEIKRLAHLRELDLITQQQQLQQKQQQQHTYPRPTRVEHPSTSSLPQFSIYNSPSYASSQSYLPRLTPPRSLYRRPLLYQPSRSISPPSANDVPGLTRSGTADTLSSLSSVSSRESSISPAPSRGTPSSVVSSYLDDTYRPGSLEPQFSCDDSSPGMYHLRERPLPGARQLSYTSSREDLGKPLAKKIRTNLNLGQGILSRFLSGGYAAVGAGNGRERIGVGY